MFEQFHHGGTTHAVERGVRNAQITAPGNRETLHHMIAIARPEFGRDEVVPGVRTIPQGGGARAARVALHRLVVGRHNLGAAGTVEFETVVEGRVVRRGDHDARRGAQGAHGVRHQRSGPGTGHLQDRPTRAQQHRHDLVVERFRPPTRVAPDDDRPRAVGARVAQPRHHALGGSPYAQSVHSRRPGHDGTA